MPKPALAWFAAFLVIVTGSVFSFAAPLPAFEIKENRLFMKEFSRFVTETVDSEPRIRERMRAFVKRHKDVLREGFGRHPELMPELFAEAGLERLNCVQGKYYALFIEKLNREELSAFYVVSQTMDYWAYMLALEEADRFGIFKPSPPLTFRQPAAFPAYMGISMKNKVQPYLDIKLRPSDINGLSFDKLGCDG